jgi:copper chaperone NosL
MIPLARRRAMRVRLMPVALLLLALACTSSGPRPIAYGEETCGYCRMTIADRRFGAEARTVTGKVHTFDSIECLAGYVGGIDAAELRGAWVTDYNDPGALVAVDSATFWQVSGAVSPMAKGLVATTGGRRPAGLDDVGEALAWETVVVRTKRVAARGGEHAY